MYFHIKILEYFFSAAILEQINAEEREFETQYADWMKQYNDWKEQNKSKCLRLDAIPNLTNLYFKL